MSTHANDDRSGKRLGGITRFSIHTEIEFPWMRIFAIEVEKREERKRLIRELFRKDPKRYGFLVAEFMDGVLVPLWWRLRDFLSKYYVWSRECVQVVYDLTAKACELLLYPVSQISELCDLAKYILKDYENEAGRIVELQEKVRTWVKYGKKGIPSSC